MPRKPRAASLPTVRKAGGELTDEARMAIVVDYEAFSQGVRTKFASVKALALRHNANPKYPAKIHNKWSKSGTAVTCIRTSNLCNRKGLPNAAQTKTSFFFYV